MAVFSRNPLSGSALSDEGIYLRALEPEDWQFLYQVENAPAQWAISNTVAPFSKAVLEEYLHHSHQDIYTVRQLRLMVCLENHESIGTVDLYDFDPVNLRAGVGIMIKAEHRRQQAAAKTLAILHRYCTHVLHLHQLYCTIQDTNGASLALFSKCGYTRVGTRHDWLRTAAGWQDVVEMQKILASR